MKSLTKVPDFRNGYCLITIPNLYYYEQFRLQQSGKCSKQCENSLQNAADKANGKSMNWQTEPKIILMKRGIMMKKQT
jgi:hypothetical protein